MSISCEDVLGLIATGGNDVERRPEVVEHLKACARCRDEATALLAAARAIRAAPVAVWTGHPASDQIVALALDPEVAALDVDQRATEHVAECATCAAEVLEVRRAEQARSSSRRHALHGPGAFIPSLRDALAGLVHGPLSVRVAWTTGLGILLLAYPAFLGLHQLPHLRRQQGSLESRIQQLETEVRDRSTALAMATRAGDELARWSGPVRLFALSGAVRGQTRNQTVTPDPAKPYVLISVRPILTEPSAESDVYRIVIHADNGREIWSSALTVEDMRIQVKSSGALIFPIPTTLLTPGSYELRVLPVRSPGEPILQVPFDIESAG